MAMREAQRPRPGWRGGEGGQRCRLRRPLRAPPARGARPLLPGAARSRRGRGRGAERDAERAAGVCRRDDSPANLRGWLLSIAHNEAVSLLRRTRSSEPLEAGHAGAGPGADEGAFQRERLRQLVDDLHALPDRQRGALLLREASGFSYRHIASVLGTSAATRARPCTRRGATCISAGWAGARVARVRAAGPGGRLARRGDREPERHRQSRAGGRGAGGGRRRRDGAGGRGERRAARRGGPAGGRGDADARVRAGRVAATPGRASGQPAAVGQAPTPKHTVAAASTPTQTLAAARSPAPPSTLTQTVAAARTPASPSTTTQTGAKHSSEAPSEAPRPSRALRPRKPPRRGKPG